MPFLINQLQEPVARDNHPLPPHPIRCLLHPRSLKSRISRLILSTHPHLGLITSLVRDGRAIKIVKGVFSLSHLNQVSRASLEIDVWSAV